MISEPETNFVYLSDKLKIKHSQFYSRLISKFQYSNISFGILPKTNDIWARDYMPIQVNENKFIRFAYEPDYLANLNNRISRNKKICEEICIPSIATKLIIDGGNVIKSKSRIILTDKIFIENDSFRQNEIIAELEELFETDKIIIIPRQPYDILGHADGLIRFFNEDTVLVNDFSLSKDSKSFKDKFFRILRRERLDLVEITYSPEYRKGKDGLDVATGIYINFLQVGSWILLPVFNQKKDNEALKIVDNLFENVETIDARDIAENGGVLNCISWTIKKQLSLDKKI